MLNMKIQPGDWKLSLVQRLKKKTEKQLDLLLQKGLKKMS